MKFNICLLGESELWREGLLVLDRIVREGLLNKLTDLNEVRERLEQKP